jgi:hypothetical protein
MQNLAETFAALWYPVLMAANLSIEWPVDYILYAQTHPPPGRTWRHRATAKIVEQDTSSGSESSDEDDADGYDSGDNVDVSPYR